MGFIYLFYDGWEVKSGGGGGGGGGGEWGGDEMRGEEIGTGIVPILLRW